MPSILVLKQTINPASFYLRTIGGDYSKHSKDWIAPSICPFHADNSPGSFFINRKTGAFKCFACDARGGDIIDFLMLYNRITLNEALERLQNDFL